MKKIYLAGPDVFRRNAKQHGEILKSLCDQYGFKGLFPFDNEVDLNLSKSEQAKKICDLNKEMIKDCDIVLANLNRFRGPSADVGTVFEIGYALGLGKEVYGYRMDDLIYKDMVHRTSGSDYEYPNIEDFGLSDNLMIDKSVSIFRSVIDALIFLEKKEQEHREIENLVRTSGLSQDQIEDLALKSTQNFGTAKKFIFWDEDTQEPVTVDLTKKTLAEKAHNFLRKMGIK